MMVSGRVHSTESFGSVDGPGVRFVIFLQGCRLRCRYCHNPDTWSMEGGELRGAEELLDSAERYRGYWGSEGGITVSGGEPLLQIDFLLDLFRNARLRGIHTCIDTAGQPFTRETDFFPKFSERATPWKESVITSSAFASSARKSGTVAPRIFLSAPKRFGVVI